MPTTSSRIHYCKPRQRAPLATWLRSPRLAVYYNAQPIHHGSNEINPFGLRLEDIAAAPLTPPANTEELHLTLRDLYSALRRLPGNQRSAVILIGVEGKSYDEAANAMETTAGAVRSHLARGRERLRATLRGTETRLPFGPRPAGTPADTAPRNMQLALTAAGDD